MNELTEIMSRVEHAAAKKAKDLMDMAYNFLHLQSAGGIVLALAAVAALIVANSPLYSLYDHIFNGISFRIGFDDFEGGFDYQIRKPLLLWVNDGLMAAFFFLVGLEIKRAVVDGDLSSRGRALLPALAAVGGIVVPALIFWQINQGIPENIDGWAIPAATDIAFALGVLSLLGDKVSTRIKLLLTAIAIIDDLVAILIIAFFYSSQIYIFPLYFAAAAMAALFALNRYSVHRVTPYVLCSIVLWMAVLESGVHATLAGVIAAFFIPNKLADDPDHSPCKELMHAMHPWVAFGILPIFAFANAGVSFEGVGLSSLQEPLTLGIMLGLLLGKPLGIFACLLLAVKSGLSPMPRDSNWTQLFAVSVLCGIGFTMSLFIGELAFDGMDKQVSTRLGVLIASVVAAIIGYLILRFGPKPPAPDLVD